MYQITIGAEKCRSNWIGLIGRKIRPIIKNSGVMIVEEASDRIFLGVGTNGSNFNDEIYGILFNFFLKDLKEEYLYSHIKRYAINEYLVRVYVKVLNLFNTEEEKEILNKCFCLYSNFSLDGFYKFRLKKLKEKWHDLVLLSANNVDLLCNDYSMTVLIKHLLACLPTVCDSVNVDYLSGEYQLSFSDGEVVSVQNKDDVVMLIIDHLPDCVHLSNICAKNGVSEQITSIFDVKYVQFI